MQKGSDSSQPPDPLLARDTVSVQKKIDDLKFRCSELHRRKDTAGAIALQLDVIRLLEQHRASAREQANGHNYLSMLYMKTGELAKAELHARQAVDLDQGDQTLRDLDATASYSMVLARILALQGRFSEAVPFAEAAIKEWTIVQGPPNDFLKTRQDELQSLRAETWSIRSFPWD